MERSEPLAAYAVEYKEFDRLLRLYPQFGDPQIDLMVGEGQIRTGIIRPLAMKYGVHEDKRIVFCASPPVLLPMARADAAEGE